MIKMKELNERAKRFAEVVGVDVDVVELDEDMFKAIKTFKDKTEVYRVNIIKLNITMQNVSVKTYLN